MAKIITKNKSARFNYELISTFEAGLVLDGWEVKSIRAGKVQLTNAFVSFLNEEAYLSNMRVEQYMTVAGDETRPRKLLLHKAQVKKLRNEVKTKGMAIVPVILKWSSKGFVKVDIALGKGKTKIDKRETIKKRDIDRQIKKSY